MATVPVTNVDATRLRTLLTAAKQAKHEIGGEECLAFAQAFHWGTAHLEIMTRELKAEVEATAAAQKAADLSFAMSAKEQEAAAAKAAAEATEKSLEPAAAPTPMRGKRRGGHQ